MELPNLLLRLTVSFFVLLFLTRIMGRKEISEMTFFNFASAIAIGEIAASLVVDDQLSISNGIYALIGWSLYTILMSYLDIKTLKGRQLLTGSPIILIKEGKILEQALHKCRLDLDTLKAMLRQKDVFSIAEVDFAIFETDGKLSVLKKDSGSSITNKNMYKVKNKLIPFPLEIILDGNIKEENLINSGFDNNWLIAQLQRAGIHSISEVFYAEVQTDGSLYIDKKV
ncbi:DUF421 domain-containing protein [Niallia taxi]|uniref:DUF421 domain-containing protein n=1 Tax=Niallia taxi TaxID=2499688 RepID=UPI00203EC35A|nr:DUF421 domain-containing protein [Niallia taxi]MCM3213659.1 DUF421 domain-containing protein [Niallia taxi]